MQEKKIEKQSTESYIHLMKKSNNTSGFLYLAYQRVVCHQKFHLQQYKQVDK